MSIVPGTPKIPWKIIAALVVTVALTVITIYGGHTVMDWKAGYEQNQQRAQGQAATTGVISDTAQANDDRATDEQAESTARADYNTKVNEEKKRDPVIRARADRPVPERLRQLARERRLARERAASARNGGEGPRPTEDAPER